MSSAPAVVLRIVAEPVGGAHRAPEKACASLGKALEEELGVPLFIRAKRGVILTDAGRIALEYARRILAEADRMLSAAAAM